MRIQKPKEPISEPSAMETAAKIFRRSIFTLVQNFQYFTTTAAFLAFPYAASVLLFQSYIPSSSFLGVVHARIRALFDAAGFPSSSSSEFSAILSAKLSQTIAISFLALPLTLSSFLLSKASVIRSLLGKQELPERMYTSLLLTQLCNSLLVLSANAACFFLLLVAFNLSPPRFELFVSVVGAVFCSIVLANAFIICNLALVISGTETTGGFVSILKACVLIKGRTATALLLAVPINVALAAVEALFQYRVVRVHHLHAESGVSSVALEGVFIAYMYATLLVLDTILACFFLRNCQEVCHIGHDRRLASQIDIDQQALWRVKIVEDHP